MNLIDSLRDLHDRRRTDVVHIYWQAVAAVAAGAATKLKPSEIDAALQALGKTTVDIEQDAALLHELAAHEPLAAQLDDLRGEVSAAGQAGGAKLAEADALEKRAVDLRHEADRDRRAAEAACSRAEVAAGEVARLRRALAARGHPGAAQETAAAAADRDHEVEVARLSHQIAEADAELRDAEAALPHTRGSYGQGKSLEAAIGQLRRRRDGLAQKLAAAQAQEAGR